MVRCGTAMGRCASHCSWIVLLAACTASEPSWKLVDHDEPAALLSIWGADANDVWVVGARTELGGGPTVLHFHDGWTRVDTGQTDLDLWWLFGLSSDDIFLGGTGGTILRLRGGVFERMTTPRTGTIFGIWAANEHDVWAVGDGGAGGAIVWHFDGTSWTEPPLPSGVPSRVFKVHGQASDDVWMACGDGSVLHWQGTAIERQTTGADVPLFSIVTTPDDVIAVGGLPGGAVGEIFEHDGEWTRGWQDVPIAWRGTAAGDTAVYALGEDGVVAKREAGAWARLDQRLSQQNFHAAWVDPAGGLWGVGGDFDRVPLTTGGFVEYFGTAAIQEVP